MADQDFVELRGDVARADIDVMDAVAQATPGASRMGLLREIMADWAKRMEAMMVVRVSGANGIKPEPQRNRGGSGARR